MLCGCGHPFALGPVEREAAIEGGADPVLTLQPRPGGLVAHVEFDAAEARRTWRVRELAEGVLELDVRGHVKEPAPWTKCAVVIERNRADLEIGGLSEGRWEVQLVVDGESIVGDSVVVPPAGGDARSSTAKRGWSAGEPGC
jgi:hypothetical protein